MNDYAKERIFVKEIKYSGKISQKILFNLTLRPKKKVIEINQHLVIRKFLDSKPICIKLNSGYKYCQWGKSIILEITNLWLDTNHNLFHFISLFS